jgi:hypothetical protein
MSVNDDDDNHVQHQDDTVENPMSYNDYDDNHVQEDVGEMIMMTMMIVMIILLRIWVR